MQFLDVPGSSYSGNRLSVSLVDHLLERSRKTFKIANFEFFLIKRDIFKRKTNKYHCLKKS